MNELKGITVVKTSYSQNAIQEKPSLEFPASKSSSWMDLTENLSMNKSEIYPLDNWKNEILLTDSNKIQIHFLMQGFFRFQAQKPLSFYGRKGRILICRQSDHLENLTVEPDEILQVLSFYLDIPKPKASNDAKKSDGSLDFTQAFSFLLENNSFAILHSSSAIYDKSREIYALAVKHHADLPLIQRKYRELISLIVSKSLSSLHFDHQMAEAILTEIQNHPTHSPHLYDLQDALGISAYMLNKIFFHRYGHTIKNQIRSTRLDAACHALKHSSLSILEIAESVGFENPSKFSRFFNESLGLNPSEYRKSYRNTSMNT